ncbi:hypothetical protein KBP53_06620 [Corynebacterium genitalium ATCC 33030]|mgnify:CR=1 FL=1|uniref:Secreted protein n=1 Tax=Corynebacterium genitalium ATCC 33030 TaxID=585529 RepID=D7WCF4_9CORY|nr:hypothetical protein [Corynebacterium genitalium]EFK53835.1 hypothetical protein HMPREF0291_11492 [Corynebacterium genitalium ATCC 33030]UUA88608.1 hypothetical protein KBP53_06620 [Corynebacterium genitalium ATCC 33030]
MKIRKGLLAAATAATVSISGMTVPAFAEEPADNNTSSSKLGSSAGVGGSSTPKGENGEAEANSFLDEVTELSSNDEGKLDPKLITAWIGVFSAIITALGALFTFIDKNFKK